jgi:hypothetical protein
MDFPDTLARYLIEHGSKRGSAVTLVGQQVMKVEENAAVRCLGDPAHEQTIGHFVRLRSEIIDACFERNWNTDRAPHVVDA